MTTLATFPALPGQSISVHKKPKWATVVGGHASGRESRFRRFKWPLWDFELAYDGLDATAGRYGGLGGQTLQDFAGFFDQREGADQPFLYVDPTDFQAVGQAIAAGDGTTASFTMVRAIGPFVGPVDVVTSVGAVYLNGVAAPSGWTVANGYPYPMLTFGAAPGLDVAISADFTYAYLVRFSDDVEDLEEFLTRLFTIRSVKLQSVRVSTDTTVFPLPPPPYKLGLVEVHDAHSQSSIFPSGSYSYIMHSGWFCVPPSDSTNQMRFSHPIFQVTMDNSRGALSPTCEILFPVSAGGPYRFDGVFNLTQGFLWHVLFFCDLTANTTQFYLNDAPVTISGGTGWSGSGTLDVGIPWFGVAGNLAGDPGNFIPGGVADWWLAVGSPGGTGGGPITTPIDLSIEANRRKFITADLLPVYLGAHGELPFGYQPNMFLTAPNVPVEILTNYGFGGTFFIGFPGTDPEPSWQPPACLAPS